MSPKCFVEKTFEKNSTVSRQTQCDCYTSISFKLKMVIAKSILTLMKLIQFYSRGATFFNGFNSLASFHNDLSSS